MNCLVVFLTGFILKLGAFSGKVDSKLVSRWNFPLVLSFRLDSSSSSDFFNLERLYQEGFLVSQVSDEYEHQYK